MKEKNERKKERERATHEGRFHPLASFAHTISDHYTCTRIRSRSARRYARVKKRGMLQSGRKTEKSSERELERRREWEREKEKEILAHARAKRGKLLHASKSRPAPRRAPPPTAPGLSFARRDAGL